jgi:hypothetical protein
MNVWILLLMVKNGKNSLSVQGTILTIKIARSVNPSDMVQGRKLFLGVPMEI